MAQREFLQLRGATDRTCEPDTAQVFERSCATRTTPIGSIRFGGRLLLVARLATLTSAARIASESLSLIAMTALTLRFSDLGSRWRRQRKPSPLISAMVASDATSISQANASERIVNQFIIATIDKAKLSRMRLPSERSEVSGETVGGLCFGLFAQS